MLIKWSDLEPGDKLKFRKEIIKYYKNLPSGSSFEWANRYKDFILIVKSVEDNGSTIKLSFINYDWDRGGVTIDYDGFCYSGYSRVCELFDVVELVNN